MECPNIDREFKGDNFNIPINYKELGGNCDYIFYDHIDPLRRVTRVQFCKKIGRKKDVFECLNENEWRNCYAYKAKI